MSVVCFASVQAVYEQLFDLIVARINVALDPAAATAEGARSSGVDLDVDVLSIGRWKI
jgi:myosin heavy subunit